MSNISITEYHNIESRIAQANGVIGAVMDGEELQPHACNALWAATVLLDQALEMLAEAT